MQSTSATPIGYRPDIDGLRAIAVLSVVVFHTWKLSLPGGFLGVDVFFVLSGFLITSIIWKDVESNRFSVRVFYEGRIRRIAPALLSVLLMSAVAAILILLPTDLYKFGQSVLASIAFVANIYFWRDTNYFSPDAEQKPLLHIWSLGVEEQFYILFPVLLFVLGRYCRWAVLPTVIVMTVGSLALNVAALMIGGASPAFFLLPTRAWELGAGAILALTSQSPGIRVGRLVGWAGLVLLAGGLLFPLQAGLIPVPLPVVLATAMIIWAGRTAPLSLLSFRPLVGVGLISYSLYLWHWPILVFSRYYLVRDLTLFEAVLAICAMFAAALLSWRYIESPFRARSLSTRKVVLSSAFCTGGLTVLAVALVLTAGLPSRLNASAARINAAVGTNYRCAVSDFIAFGPSRACVMNLPSRDPMDAEVILLGNSHAQMYAPVVTDLLRESEVQGLLLPANACLPTVTANVSTDCFQTAEANLRSVATSNARTVIIGLTWNDEKLMSRTGDSLPHSALVGALDDLIRRLKEQGKAVVLVGPLAEPRYDMASVVGRKLAYGRPIEERLSEPRAAFMAKHEGAIEHFEARSDMKFVRPDLVQCQGSECQYTLDGRSLFSDSNHIARAELGRFREAFSTALR